MNLSDIICGTYEINADGVVDVEGDVRIPERYAKIPVQIGYVSDDFNCRHAEGAPREVGGDFNCSYTKITSLKGAPREVGGDFNCTSAFKTRPDRSFINIGRHFYW